MVPPSSRIYADLSDSSHETWVRTMETHQITTAAFLEVLAQHLDDPEMRSVLAPVIVEAQELAIERRRRR